MRFTVINKQTVTSRAAKRSKVMGSFFFTFLASAVAGSPTCLGSATAPEARLTEVFGGATWGLETAFCFTIEL
jgi:hypothetical protein